MSDAQNAAEAAIYTALSAASLAWPVHQHVPQDTPPPVHIIGDLTGEPIGAKDDPDERIELSIMSVFQGEARKAVLAEQAKIIAALDGKTLAVTGWTITSNKESADAVLLPDGETYLGTARFTLFALKS